MFLDIRNKKWHRRQGGLRCPRSGQVAVPGPGLGSRDRLAPWGGERGQVRKGSAEAPGNLPKESIQGPGPRKGTTLRHQRIDER